MITKKLIVLLLALVLCVAPVLVSCGDDTADKTGESSATSGTSNKSFPLEAKKFDTTIKILASNRHTYGKLQFAPLDEGEEGGTAAINDAVKKRNDYLEQEYGLKIEVVTVKEPGNEISLSINSGSDEYQLVCDSVNYMLPQATNNYYWSLEKNLRLNEDWWDQNAINNLSITDKTYFVAGDALITDDDFTYMILFNKKMYEENSQLAAKYGSLYDLVNNGKWTYDVMYEMAKASSSTNANGEWLKEDCNYGFLSEGYSTNILVNGSGVSIGEKTKDGKLQLNVDSERSINAFNKVFALMTDKTATVRVEHFGEAGWGIIGTMFESGKGLFYSTPACTITGILNSKVENKVQFGVLPIPKYEEKQENYFNGINIYQSSVLAVPTTNQEKLEATCYLLEALGYYSKYDFGVTKAYYETTLKLQGSDSENDEKMLDIVFNNRLYDIGGIYNWGGSLLGIYSAVMRSENNTLASSYEQIKSGAEVAMEKTIEEYNKILS